MCACVCLRVAKTIQSESNKNRPIGQSSSRTRTGGVHAGVEKVAIYQLLHQMDIIFVNVLTITAEYTSLNIHRTEER